MNCRCLLKILSMYSAFLFDSTFNKTQVCKYFVHRYALKRRLCILKLFYVKYELCTAVLASAFIHIVCYQDQGSCTFLETKGRKKSDSILASV